MTLLTICQNAADEVGIAQPTSIIGNAAPDAQKLLRYANKAGNSLMKNVGWQDLTKEQTYTSVATEEQTSILPGDFDRFCPETFWNRSTDVLISGPVSGVEWQGLKAIDYNDTQIPKYRYRGGSVFVIPTLGAGNSLAFEYISNQWCQSSGGTGQTAWVADTDVGVVDEELITRAVKFLYLDDEGLPSQKAEEEFTDYLNTLVRNDQPSAGVMVAGDIFGMATRHFSGTPPVQGQSLVNW